MGDKTTSQLRDLVHEKFMDAFGRTPLRQRLDDIYGEATELHRYTDFKNLKEEAGDALASLLALCAENEWDPEELVCNTLLKIARRRLQYKSLGRKIKVALYGGAFDPITIGHIRTAQAVLNGSREFDEVWITPVFQHMYGKKMTPPEHRLDMCNLAAKIDGRLKVFPYEIEHQLAGETYHLVKRLLDEKFAKDQYDFSVVIGQDNANTFDKWVNYELLQNAIRFVVVPRPGYALDPNVQWYLKPPHIFMAPDPNLIAISSTDVRKFIADGKPEMAAPYLAPEVLRYICNNRLYREGAQA